MFEETLFRGVRDTFSKYISREICTTKHKAKSVYFLLGQPGVAKVTDATDNAPASSLIAGITIAVLVLTLIIVIMFIYYKRRMGRLKSENRAVMQYIQSTEGADSGEGQYNSPSAYRTHDTVSQLWYTGLRQVIFAIQPFSLTLKAI